MKKSACKNLANLPISKKAYFGFISRIEAVFSYDESSVTLMRDALDSYLSGDSDVIGTLPEPLRFAFEFLCQEVDCAINRSTRARLRAALRKLKPGTTKAPVSNTPIPNPSGMNEIQQPTTADYALPESSSPAATNIYYRPLTRQQRRAREREARKNAMQAYY